MLTNESEAYAESEAYDSASVVPIHTRSELSSDSDSAYESASVASVASVNQPLMSKTMAVHVRNCGIFGTFFLPSTAKLQREMAKFCVVWKR